MQRLGDLGGRRGKKRDVRGEKVAVTSELHVRSGELRGEHDLLRTGELGGRGGPGQRLLAGRVPAAGLADVVARPAEGEARRGKSVLHVGGKVPPLTALRSGKADAPGARAEGQSQASRGNPPTPDPGVDREGRAPARRDDAFRVDLEAVEPTVGCAERDPGLLHRKRLSERRRRSRYLHEFPQFGNVVVRNRHGHRQRGRFRYGGERHAPFVHGGREGDVGLVRQFGGVQLDLDGGFEHRPAFERSKDLEPLVGGAFRDGAAPHRQLHRWFRVPVEQRDSGRYDGPAPIAEIRRDYNGLRSFPEVVIRRLDVDLQRAASLAVLDGDLVGSARPVISHVVSVSPLGGSRPPEHRVLSSRSRLPCRHLSRGEGGRDGHLYVGRPSQYGLAHRGDIRREDDGSKRLVIRDRDGVARHRGNPRRARGEDDRLVLLDGSVVDRRKPERRCSKRPVCRDGDRERGQSGVVGRPPTSGGCRTAGNPDRDRHVLGKTAPSDRRGDRDLHGAAVLRDLVGGDRQVNAPRRLGAGVAEMDGEQQERDRGDGTRAPACP